MGIIAVVLIHCTPRDIHQVYYRPFINFAVGLFLFLSGMLSNVDCWKPQKRIKKVIVPYIIWTLLYVIMHNYKSPSTIPFEYFKGLVTGSSAAIMYYIWVYIELTLLIPFIHRLANSKYMVWGFIVSPLEIVLFRLIPIILGWNMNYMLNTILELSCLCWFSFFYLGYLQGNGIIGIKQPIKRLIVFWVISIFLQITEGYWLFSKGINNCGTQTKISTLVTGIIVCFIINYYINSKCSSRYHLLHLLGDYSFGIFFSHLLFISVLNKSVFYRKYVPFPINACVILIISFTFVYCGRKILGKYSKIFAL